MILHRASEPSITLTMPRLFTYAKGRITWDGDAWVVEFPYRIGMQATYRESEKFSRWMLAIGEYREHSRNVMRSSPAPLL